MSDPLRHLSLFGLDQTECSLITTLVRDGRQSVSTLARELRVPRMTVFDTLQRLHTQGLVRPVPVGKRTHWKVVDLATLKTKAIAALEGLKQLEDAETHTLASVTQLDPNELGVRTFRGKQQIKQAYEQLFCKRTRSAEVFAVDGTHFFADYFAYLSEYESELRFARTVQHSGNIVRVVMVRSNLDALKAAALPADVYEAMFAAPIELRIVPDELLQSATELALFDGFATILIPKRLTLMVVEQPELLATFRGLCDSLYEHAEAVNTYELLQSFLR